MTVLMLLTNAYDPDPRVRQEALALLRMGCRVRLLAWDRDVRSPATECIEGVEVERVFVRSSHGRGTSQALFYAWLYVRMLWRALRIPCDTVHCHDLDTLPLGFIAGKLKRKPVVYDAHESFTGMLAGSVHSAVLAGLTRLENFLIRRVDLLITVGDKLRAHFVRRGARNAVVVGNWKRLLEYARTDAENADVRLRLGIPAGARVVVCITQLLRDRKLLELLQAVESCPDIWLIVGGKGAMEGTVREYAAANPRIVYVGFVSATDIPAYTCAADIVYYGFDPRNPNAEFSAPNKLFEALAAGRPLITGDFGEIADVVRQGVCGVVLKSYSADEICAALAVLGDAGVYRPMAANARELARTVMNWERGERVLYESYSKFAAGALRLPAQPADRASTVVA